MTAPDRSFEDRIMDAVVGQFFAPQWVQSSSWNPATNMHEPTLVQVPSAAARVAADIWAAKKDEIVAAVKDHLDLDAIAEKVAEKVSADVTERLTTTRTFHGYDRDREEMRKMVNGRIADELARRALAKMDAEQAAETTEETG